MAYLEGYTKRVELTIDHDKVDANLTDVSVVVKLTSSNFDFSKPTPNGYGVQFTSLDGVSPLAFECELYDATSSTAWFHVRVPSISSSSDTIFYIYYGKTATMYEMFLDTVYVEAKDAGLDYMRNTAAVRPTKYAGNPVFGNSRFRDVGKDDGGVYVSDGTETECAGFSMLPAVPVVGDRWAFCMKNPDDRIKLDINLPMQSTSHTIVWKQWNDANAWEALDDVVDGTIAAGKSLAQDGYVKWTIPANWKSDGDPYGAAGLSGYWLCAELTAEDTITQVPTLTKAWIDVWDYDKITVSVAKDGSTYKMWYSAADKDVTQWRTACYTTSMDGLVWTKPNLGQHTFDGNTNNNLLTDWYGKGGPGSMVYDSDNSRWMGIVTAEALIFTSVDGITSWTEQKDLDALFPHEAGMGCLCLRLDGKIIVYYQHKPDNDSRSIATALTDTTDVTGAYQWTGIPIKVAAATNQKYSVKVEQYGQIYVAFIARYNRTAEQIPAIELWVSRDGLNFTEIDSSWLEVSVGQWDDDMLIPGSFMQVTGAADTDWWFYYSGHSETHDVAQRRGRIGIAKLGYRRLGGVKRGAGVGTDDITTTLLQGAEGNILYVNVDSSGGGTDKLEVELLDSADAPIAGYTKALSDAISENNAAKAVTWNGGATTILPSGTFKIKFYFTNDTGTVRLYAFSLDCLDTNDYSLKQGTWA